MKNSIITICFFIAGCFIGAHHEFNSDIHEWAVYVLYGLMICIGMNLGANENLKEFVKCLRPKMLLVPLGTIAGTIVFSALGALILRKWSVSECISVGCGFAYYSVSSVLITQIKTASIGLQMATELGTIALLSNIFREMIGLIGTPFIRKHFGALAPISAAGIGSADITLGMITQCSGMKYVPVAIVHGLLINISMPFLVTFFCNM